jgi:predicted phosphodiesterase
MPLLDSIRESRVTKKPLGVAISTDEYGVTVIEAHKSEQIKTLPQLLEVAQVDQDRWEVKDWKSNVWNNFSGAHGLVHLWQVKAQLKARDLSQKNIREILEAGFKSFVKSSKLPVIPAPKQVALGTMVEFALPDLHLGKLSWGPETGGGNWDTGIAVKVYSEALDDLISRTPTAEEARLVVGNDFFNVDNGLRTTTNGTVQDEDGRWQKTFVLGQKLMLEAIAKLLKKFKFVRVIVVYGNHDRERSFYLGESIKGYFHQNKRVAIENEPADRKFFQWGETGIGYCHGDRLKAKDLSHLCQFEAREMWGKTKRFELHLGHLHQEIVKIIGGVILRWLPAICPPDAWHSKSGYTMAEKAAVAMIYDIKGLRETLYHYPRPELFM